jgi:VPDSG-CTERM motif
MKLYLICTLAAVALALNAEAAPKDKEKDKPPVIIVDKVKDKNKGPIYSVPDAGSTALLLGTAILALGLARRRFFPLARLDSRAHKARRRLAPEAGFSFARR